MRPVGKLLLADKGNYSQCEGHIATLEFDLRIDIASLESPRSIKSPTHSVASYNAHGTRVEIGAAWLKTSKATHTLGKKFFSIVIDDPSFSKPLNLMAFPNSDETEMDLVLERNRGQQTAV